MERKRIEGATPLEMVSNCEDEKDTLILLRRFEQLIRLVADTEFRLSQLRKLAGLDDAAPMRKLDPAPNREVAFKVAMFMSYANRMRPNVFTEKEIRETVMHGIGLTDPTDHIVRRNRRELLAAYTDNDFLLSNRTSLVRQAFGEKMVSASDARLAFGLSDSAPLVFVEDGIKTPDGYCYGIASSMSFINRYAKKRKVFRNKEIAAVARWEYGLGLPPA